MRGAQFFLFLLTLPVVAVIGHDLYLFYENQDRGFMLSALGFLWTHYDQGSYEWAVQNTPPEQWAIINQILAMKALYVTGALAGFFYILFGILKIFGLWPFNDDSASYSSSSTGNSRANEILGRKRKVKIKYKRK